MTRLYHATTYDNMRMILGYDEADIEFGETNGFAPGKVFGFEGKAFLSEKPVDLDCVGGTYFIAVEVPGDLEQYRYLDDDDHYHCKNYAIPVEVLNQCEMWRYEESQ